MLAIQLERELKQLIRKEKFQMDMAIVQANKHIGYIKPKPECEQLYIEGWLDNKRYANIRGLESFMLEHQELTIDEITRFITSKPISLKFLNHVLHIMPEMVELILSKGAYDFALIYIRRCNEMKMSKNNFNR